jgi:hypothetical protein
MQSHTIVHCNMSHHTPTHYLALHILLQFEFGLVECAILTLSAMPCRNWNSYHPHYSKALCSKEYCEDFHVFTNTTHSTYLYFITVAIAFFVLSLIAKLPNSSFVM